jgi:hypothetical protein
MGKKLRVGRTPIASNQVVVNRQLTGNRAAVYYAFAASCLAHASATLLSGLSSPGMIAQLCFSM